MSALYEGSGSQLPGPACVLERRTAAERDRERARFVDAMRRHPLFASGVPIWAARAPGRFDVLGGIADYSGSLVLALPTADAAFVAVQAMSDGRAAAVSGARRIAIAADELLDLPLEDLARRFSGRDAWAAYVLGPVAALTRELAVRPAGIRVVVSSTVPEGKGLASSAAVEIASVYAASACFGLEVPIERLAALAQTAEHILAGAPCGPMDQLTAARGEAGKLLAILCQPAEVVASLTLPAPFALWGIDSGTTHVVAGAGYRRVRCASFIGKALLGCRGHLATSSCRESDVERLPEEMTGREFLRRYEQVEDEVSSVEPEVTYPVRAATLHPIQEHVRVQMFAELLAMPVTDRRTRLLGELMYQSNASYGRCGIGTAKTDAIVAAVRRLGWERGLAGARLSGGGSGGTVVVLGHRDAEPLVARIADELGAGYTGGSSSGAASFGVKQV